MLFDLYVEALLVDEDLADQVWDLRDGGVITDCLAAWAWRILVSDCLHTAIANHTPTSNIASSNIC